MADDPHAARASDDPRTASAATDSGAGSADGEPPGAGRLDEDNLRAAYEQLCLSYRAIDDFRAKLLGFLPLVTGGGLILLTGRSAGMREEFFRPVGLFGIAVTAGLLAYELFGIRKCHALIVAGEDLERALRLPVGTHSSGKGAGQFLRRPQSLLGVVNEPFAAATIYPAVLAAWTYLALYLTSGRLATLAGVTVFAAGFVLILIYDQLLKYGVIDHLALRFAHWRDPTLLPPRSGPDGHLRL